jgi:hypothetical protein
MRCDVWVCRCDVPMYCINVSMSQYLSSLSLVTSHFASVCPLPNLLPFSLCPPVVIDSTGWYRVILLLYSSPASHPSILFISPRPYTPARSTALTSALRPAHTSRPSCKSSALPLQSSSLPLPAVQSISSIPRFGRHNADYDDYPTVRAAASHQPTRPVDKEKTESELAVNIKKATSPEETAPSSSPAHTQVCCETKRVLTTLQNRNMSEVRP